ncbi:hypothetical protein [Patulibacter sp. SYSU D01012]|uniref:hypothetical protein n=1 Tax=Patulibacter sp. SYSU D01012 TaxID=2817381 RepID=UPI001B306287|nr:hypothetical protein [Patulibacter sp. SYSU D01012]
MRRARARLLVVLVAVLAAAMAQPAAGQAAKLRKMFWGPVALNGVSQFPIYHELGVDVFQIAITWNDAAPRRPARPTDPHDPAYVWPTSVDQAVAEARRFGMQVAVQLAGTPSWANGGRDASYAPRRPGDYGAFARAAARRYPGVRIWMVGGEPNSGLRWKPTTPQRTFRETRLSRAQQRAPRAYARVLDDAYADLKAVNRRNVVVGGMSFSGGDTRPENWARYLRLPNGRPPRMDLYGHNPFGLRRPDLTKPPSPTQVVDMSDLRRLRRVIDARLAKPRGKRSIRLYLSEYTIPTGPDSEFIYYTTLKAQAAWIPDAFAVAHQVGAWGLGWVHLYDGDNIGSGTHGGLLFENGLKKPGYDAFRRAH